MFATDFVPLFGSRVNCLRMVQLGFWRDGKSLQRGAGGLLLRLLLGNSSPAAFEPGAELSMVLGVNLDVAAVLAYGGADRCQIVRAVRGRRPGKIEMQDAGR